MKIMLEQQVPKDTVRTYWWISLATGMAVIGVVALKDTISVASQLLEGAESLNRHTATIEVALTGMDQNESQIKGEGAER